MLTIHSPEPEFSGDIAGVRFSEGAASVDPQAPHAAAALAYFRRRGYRVVEESAVEAGPGNDEGATSDTFDPADHTVAEVLAYLGSAGVDEHARVLAAEAAGQARATILKKGQPSE